MTQTKFTARSWLALTILCAAQFMMVLDLSDAHRTALTAGFGTALSATVGLAILAIVVALFFSHRPKVGNTQGRATTVDSLKTKEKIE